ncbi:hypothetical protein DSO57_1022771 [Entomophthora muscae]|uniref:Uncharacterized protein n=1 Tax=Entomophthora muscae TaxID=34485 RepID=A0ACC2T373_9FUNG|nr:hypothetical protein DSO57_1022771 [Entomophthora muscae]
MALEVSNSLSKIQKLADKYKLSPYIINRQVISPIHRVCTRSIPLENNDIRYTRRNSLGGGINPETH